MTGNMRDAQALQEVEVGITEFVTSNTEGFSSIWKRGELFQCEIRHLYSPPPIPKKARGEVRGERYEVWDINAQNTH